MYSSSSRMASLPENATEQPSQQQTQHDSAFASVPQGPPTK